jgi:hypothetical protein
MKTNINCFFDGWKPPAVIPIYSFIGI